MRTTLSNACHRLRPLRLPRWQRRRLLIGLDSSQQVQAMITPILEKQPRQVSIITTLLRTPSAQVPFPQNESSKKIFIITGSSAAEEILAPVTSSSFSGLPLFDKQQQPRQQPFSSTPSPFSTTVKNSATATKISFGSPAPQPSAGASKTSSIPASGNSTVPFGSPSSLAPQPQASLTSTLASASKPPVSSNSTPPTFNVPAPSSSATKPSAASGNAAPIFNVPPPSGSSQAALKGPAVNFADAFVASAREAIQRSSPAPPASTPGRTLQLQRPANTAVSSSSSSSKSSSKPLFAPSQQSRQPKTSYYNPPPQQQQQDAKAQPKQQQQQPVGQLDKGMFDVDDGDDDDFDDILHNDSPNNDLQDFLDSIDVDDSASDA